MAEWAIRPQGLASVCDRDSAPVDAHEEARIETFSMDELRTRGGVTPLTEPYLTGVIAVTDIGVVRPITTSPTLIFFSMSCVAIERAE